MSESGGLTVISPGGPAGRIPQHTSSGVVANGVASASIPAAAGKTSYLSGLEITGLGATGAAQVVATVNNGAVVASYSISVPAGVTTPISPVQVALGDPVPGATPNQAVTVSVPAFGNGNTTVIVNAHGYQA
jgi:hypothetical protein